MSNKYVIAKSFYGLGGNLAVLACAWLVAKKLDRRLIADWRGGYYGDDTNYFSLLFHQLPNQATFSEINQCDSKVFPDYWQPHYQEVPQHRKDVPLTSAHSDLPFASDSKFDNLTHDIIIVSRDGSHFHKPEYLQEIRSFFNQLRPADQISLAVDNFVESKFRERMIGVHFRHGNGEATVVPPDFDWFKSQIDHFSNQEDAASSGIFVATDCAAVIDRMRKDYGERVVAYPKDYPLLGSGGMHYRSSTPEKLESAVEALIDMLLLSNCNYFVGSKSFFSSCAHLWGTQLNRSNSRWFPIRLRAFRPNSRQISISSLNEIAFLLGERYPIDNLFLDLDSDQITYLDIPIVGRTDLLEGRVSVDVVKATLTKHRLY